MADRDQNVVDEFEDAVETAAAETAAAETAGLVEAVAVDDPTVEIIDPVVEAPVAAATVDTAAPADEPVTAERPRKAPAVERAAERVAKRVEKPARNPQIPRTPEEEAARPHRMRKVKNFAYKKTPERFKNASSFQVRFRTGAVYIALSIICLIASDITTLIFVAATAGICAGEFYYMQRSDAKLPNEIIGIIGAILYPVGVYFLGLKGAVYVTLLLTFALAIWYVYWMRARIPDVGVSLFGAVYLGLSLSSLILMRQALEDPWGGVLLIVLFLSIWANDAFAYLIGSKIGRHKLAPKTSPKKSWEGFIAGLIFSMAFWCITIFIPGMNIGLYQALIFGLIVGCASVVGDLCESRIKRGAGFKDSGTIMPGHGGLFDRCDSLITAAVVAAVLLFGAGCLPFPG